MRSAQTSACYIEANIMPLALRRESAALEMAERYRRTEDKHPNHQICTLSLRFRVQKMVLGIEGGTNSQRQN